MSAAFTLLVSLLVIASAAAIASHKRLSEQLMEDARILELLYSDEGTSDGHKTRNSKKWSINDIRVGKCYRPCRLGKPPRICHYRFEVENYVAMGDACGDCPRNRTACFDPQCVITDGYERTVLTVNRMIPGPSLHVCRGDIVVVDLHNMMHDRSTSIHWHGVIQSETPHSDGVADLTQCSISPGSTFRYVFKTSLGGTHFWHSHMGLQKMDGVVGKLVVRVPPEEDPNSSEYDLDLKEHSFMITDWIHDLTDERFPGVRFRLNSTRQQQPDTYLLDGLGRYVDPLTGMSTSTPLWNVNAFVGVRQRFRVVNGGCTVCPAKLTIEGHRFRVVAADLHPVRPMTVDAINILPGERYDFVLVGPRDVSAGDLFWIHVAGIGPCEGIPVPPSQLGVLRYISTPASFYTDNRREPVTVAPDRGFEVPGGTTLNSITGRCNVDRREVCASSMQFFEPSVGPPTPSFTVTPPEQPFRFVAAYGFYIHRKEDLFQSNTFQRYIRPGLTVSATFNNLSMIFPPSPALSQLHDIPPENFCPSTNLGLPGQQNHYTECFNVVRIPLNALVEILLHPEAIPVPLPHPFHLHGYDFQVLHQGLVNITSPNELHNLRDSFFSGNLQAQPDSPIPPLRDTIAVPPLGYAVIRFRAMNPGFWLFHCHFAFHLAAGMALVMQVGEPSDFVPTPPGFPKCGDYIPRLS